MRLRLLTAGESHGPGLVAVLEGLPHGLEIDLEAVQGLLRRRQGGYGRSHRQSIEKDRVEVLGGLRHGRTLGSPLALVLRNRDFDNWRREMAVEAAPEGWSPDKPVRAPRPGHADLAGAWKLLATDPRDVLERASARETAARTAAGAFCLQLLEAVGTDVKSHVLAVGDARVPEEALPVSWDDVEAIDGESDFRCADATAAEAMRAAVEAARRDGDTLGGVFEVVAHGVPAGLGSHVHWDRKLDGRLLQAVGSIQGVKAAEIGDGVRAAGLPGSRVHDPVVPTAAGGLGRSANRAGGLEGGITNGEEVRVRGYMKPLSTLMQALESVDLDTGEPRRALVERSDVCAVPAAAVVGEAMAALVLADAVLEKFGGDSMEELRANLGHHRRRARDLFPRQGGEEKEGP